MANPEHLKILEQGVEAWNRWMEMDDGDEDADLSGAVLTGRDLTDIDFNCADLEDATFTGSRLDGANFSHAQLDGTNFLGASLAGAYFCEAMLSSVIFSEAELRGADFTDARFAWCTFAANDLSEVVGLDTVANIGPCSVGVDTIYASKGRIPEGFLRGCGLPESFIVQIPALVAAMQPIQFYSCFISYSHRDEDFAQRLYSRMRGAGLRVWYAPEDMQGGRKLHEQIFGAIHVHDKLLLVLSENSLRSEWVATEIRRARKVEGEERRRKLFPIRLVDFSAIQAWECFDADTGKDLGVELREYFIPDFSDWKEHDAFEKAFERLLRDLKAEEKKA